MMTTMMMMMTEAEQGPHARAWALWGNIRSMAAIGVHFGYTCACVAIFKVSVFPPNSFFSSTRFQLSSEIAFNSKRWWARLPENRTSLTNVADWRKVVQCVTWMWSILLRYLPVTRLCSLQFQHWRHISTCSVQTRVTETLPLHLMSIHANVFKPGLLKCWRHRPTCMRRHVCLCSLSYEAHTHLVCVCVCVCVQDGRADVVANDAGDRVTPSVVAFRDTEQVKLGWAGENGFLTWFPSSVIQVALHRLWIVF